MRYLASDAICGVENQKHDATLRRTENTRAKSLSSYADNNLAVFTTTQAPAGPGLALKDRAKGIRDDYKDHAH